MAFQTFLKCVKLLHSFITSKVFELASSDCAQIVGIFNVVPDLIQFFGFLVAAKRRYYAKYDCYSYEQDSMPFPCDLRKRETDHGEDGRTDGWTHPLIEMQGASKNHFGASGGSC